MRKKIIGLAFAIVCMLSMSMATFATSDQNQGIVNPNSPSATSVDVMFNAYGGMFSFERNEENDNWIKEDREFYGNELESGKTFVEQTSTYFRNMSDPVRANATFEGWLEFKRIQNTDNVVYELVSNSLYTTADLMQKSVPSYDVVYTAKWSHISAEDYYKTMSICFNANGGTMDVVFEGNTTSNQPEQWFGCYVGDCVSKSGASVSNPVYWNQNRQFEGWMIGTWEENSQGFSEFKQFVGTGLLTTAEALDYPVQGDLETIFMAKWAGNDADYHSQVYISGYDVNFTVEMCEWQNGTQTWKDVTTSSVGDYQRRNGKSFAENAASWLKFKSEPVKPGVTLEGWAEFKVINPGDGERYELVSNKIYTTQEMLSRPVPDYHVAYVAKWSDIQLEQYFKPLVCMELTANGGSFVYEFLDKNSNVVTDTAPTWGYGMVEGQAINDILLQPGVVQWKDVVRPCYEFTGWTLYECDNYDMELVPAGSQYTPQVPVDEYYYHDTIIDNDGVKYDRYILLWSVELVDSNMSTADLMNYKCTKEYYAVANWKYVSISDNFLYWDLDTDDGYFVTGIKNLVVPDSLASNSNLNAKEKIEKALSDAIESQISNGGNAVTKLMDVELFIINNNGDYVKAKQDNIPVGGVSVCIPFETFSGEINAQNANKYQFVVGHMITSESDGRELGTIELFKDQDITITDKGIWIKMKSFSPVSISYWEKQTAGNAGGESAPSRKDETTSDTTAETESKPVEVHYASAPVVAKVAPTGDNSMVGFYVVLALSALAVMVSVAIKKV